MLVAEKKYSYNNNRYSTENKESNKKRVSRGKKKNNKNLFIRISALFWVLVISSALIFVLLRYTTITEARYEVLSLKKEIKELENNLQDINAEYDSLTRSDIIEKAALDKLSMQYPKYEQMVFLDIKATEELDVTVLGEDELTNEQTVEEVNKEKKLFANIFKKLYSLLD